MKLLTLFSISLIVTLSGCAELQQKTGVSGETIGTAGGAAIGCLSGAFLAKVTGQNALGGCLVGAVAVGLISFEKVRQEEISAATKAQQEAIAALAPLTASKLVKAGEIKTIEVVATDKTKNETKKVQAFESVSLDIPLSAKGTPEYDAAISKLKILAEKVADERGSSKIDIAMTAADAKSNKVVLESGSALTSKGNSITVTKVADNSIPKGIERVTVRAGKILKTEVS